MTSSLPQSLRQRLLTGSTSYGPICMSDSPVIMELLAMAGYGHLILDHEHSPTDSSSGQVLLQAIDAGNGARMGAGNNYNNKHGGRHRTEPIIRVPDHDPTYMKKILDSMRLPGGVLVPMVEDAETAERVVAATRYPLQLSGIGGASVNKNGAHSIDGVRGCAIPFIRASGYGFGFGSNNENSSGGSDFMQQYMHQCQNDLLVMVQVETPKGVDAISEIASVRGIDGIFLGPFDLSCSVGKVGQFDDEDVRGLIERAEEAVLEQRYQHQECASDEREDDLGRLNCFLAGFQSGGRSVQQMFEAGYSLVCGSVDLGLLREAAMKDVETANKSM